MCPINELLQNEFTVFKNQIHCVLLGVGNVWFDHVSYKFLLLISTQIQPFHSVKNQFQQVLRLNNYVS